MKLSDFFGNINIKFIINNFFISNNETDKSSKSGDDNNYYISDLSNDYLVNENNSGYSNTSDFTKRDVLIGVLRNKAQLDICLKHNFYHIPADMIDKRIFPINYIAIYQSKKIFGDNSGIYYYGKVAESFPVKRYEIKEIPDNSDKLYYKFIIEKWEKLPSPILPKENGFIAKTTNLFLLNNAAEIPELWLTSYNDYILYNKIKLLAVNKLPFEHDNCRYYIKEEMITVEKGNNIIAQYAPEEYLNYPQRIFSEIK